MKRGPSRSLFHLLWFYFCYITKKLKIMENKLSSLSLEGLVALEKMISVVCGKYENIAQINKFATNDVDKKEYVKATNSLSFFNNKRGVVLEEMEKRINEIV